ncbi:MULTISPECIES: hypothetical protein [unclassified Streptomyces]|uniref:PknH-like extracellular domain-containing protein n=2 Tax=Streptomyces TaxID=1883 RepID=A0ABV5VLM2_9ACTN
MTTPPPPPPAGPPRGPLSGSGGPPPAEPPARRPAGHPDEPPPAGRRPWWRRPGGVLLATTALVAVGAAALVAVILLRGRDGDSTPDIETSTQARDVATRAALAPRDWGSGFWPATPYETTLKSAAVADDSCRFVDQTDGDLLAGLERDSERPNTDVSVASTVFVYNDDSAAEASIERTRSDTRRCPTETDGKAKWEDVHAIELAPPEGFDEVTTEEGRQTRAASGEATDLPYTLITGRKGQIVFQTAVYGSSSESRSAAVKALSLMLSRVQGARSAGP